MRTSRSSLDLAAVILACVLGAVAGAVAAARAPAPWWGLLVGPGVAALLVGVHVLTGSAMFLARKVRRVRIRPAAILWAGGGAVCGSMVALWRSVWLGVLIGVGVFALLLGLERLLTPRPGPVPDPLPPPPDSPPPSPGPRVPKSVGVVFVHGLFSSAKVWAPFQRLIAADPDLARVDLLNYQYPSPKIRFNPLKLIPTISNLAQGLRTYLKLEASRYPALVLVSHSQGGLIVQQLLAERLEAGEGTKLVRIRRVVMFACPNSGAEFALALRRLAFRRHPQVSGLKPNHDPIAHAHRVVLNRVVHAKEVTDNCCPIPVSVYAGMEDNIVKPASAAGAFPDADTLPGDHFSIIQPDSPAHRSYRAIKADLLEVLRTLVPDTAEAEAGPPATKDKGDVATA